MRHLRPVPMHWTSGFLWLCALAVLHGRVCAQDRVDNYFVLDEKDTVLCKSMNYDPGSIKKMLTYVRWSGEQEERMSATEFKHVSTFFRDGIVKERLPTDLDKPDGKSRLMQRVANGRLKMYEYRFSDERNHQTLYCFVRTPDGKLLDAVDNKELETKVNPLLEQCAEYRSAFPQPFDLKKSKDLGPQVDELIKRVHHYNDNCH